MASPHSTPNEAPSRAQFPEKLRFLFDPHRYKVAYGGRGAGKTKNFARALLIQGAQSRLKILCCREVQKSIAESVHAQLRTEIVELGLSHRYRVTDKRIYEINTGTEFLFAGLWQNIDNIKSIPDIDRCWIEEGQSVSAGSLQKLIPTIRKAGSEIWISFNPELESDAVFDMFITHDPPAGSVVEKIGWRDNPWFDDTELRSEMVSSRERDYDDYLWVWEGHPRQFMNGSVYAKELRQSENEGRITTVPYDDSSAVNLFFDLGWRDLFTCWFVQKVGLEYRALRYWQARHTRVGEFWREVVQPSEYLIGTVFLPHDGDHGTLQSDGGTVKQLFEKAGAQKVVVLDRIPTEAFGVEKVRAALPKVYFDREGCRDGLTSLRRYRFGIDDKTKEFTRKPIHNEASHGAKAFETFALSIGKSYTRPESGLTPPPPRTPSQGLNRRQAIGQTGNLGWLRR